MWKDQRSHAAYAASTTVGGCGLPVLATGWKHVRVSKLGKLTIRERMGKSGGRGQLLFISLELINPEMLAAAPRRPSPCVTTAPGTRSCRP